LVSLLTAIYTKTKRNFMLAEHLNDLKVAIHAANVQAGWYTDIKTGLPKEVNVGEKLMLIVSEVAEAMEADRKNLDDDKLPHRKGIEVELGDALIRILDLCGHLNLDIGGAVKEKLEYNFSRPDHKIENRLKDQGKKY
jgi:NTP pyrophosphatase (non-canonical NTP hydrolase)